MSSTFKIVQKKIHVMIKENRVICKLLVNMSKMYMRVPYMDLSTFLRWNYIKIKLLIKLGLPLLSSEQQHHPGNY